VFPVQAMYVRHPNRRPNKRVLRQPDSSIEYYGPGNNIREETYGDLLQSCKETRRIRDDPDCQGTNSNKSLRHSDQKSARAREARADWSDFVAMTHERFALLMGHGDCFNPHGSGRNRDFGRTSADGTRMTWLQAGA
jgi:hypothetical protein